MKKFFICACAMICTFNIATAQEDNDYFELSLEELLEVELSVGSKTIKNPDQTPGAVTVITKEQIEQLQARSLNDVLNVFVPGMDVVPTYFAYGQPVNSGIYSRGILSDFNQQILILYNGENKFNESTFGSPYAGALFTLENVERLEINTSPAPLLGGGALTTINIITKEKNLSGTEIYLNTGINEDDGLQSKRFTVNYGQYVDKWHIGTSLQYLNDLGQIHPDEEIFGFIGSDNALRDGTKAGVNLSLNLKSPNEIVEFGTWYKMVERDALFSNLNVSGSSDLYNFKSSVLHNYVKVAVMEGLEISAGVSLFDVANTINLDQPIPVGVNQRINVPSRTDLKNYNTYLKLDYLKDYKLLGQHTLNGGIKIEREGQRDHSINQLNDVNQFVDVTQNQEEEFFRQLDDGDRTIMALFAENNWNISEDLSFLAGFRYDYYQNFGNENISTLNPRFAIAYLPTKNLIVKAQYSSAVRPPSNYEIAGNNFIPQLYGNNNITFESLDTYEVSVKYRTDDFEITVNPYIAKFDNRITYIPSSIDTTSNVASNNGKTDVFGIEISTRYSWKTNQYVFLNASQQDSEDGLTNERTSFIPEFYLNGGLNLGFDKLNINFTGYYRGDRALPSDLLVNTAKATDSQLIVNSAITYNVASGVKIYTQIQNLLDKESFVPLSKDGLYVPLRGRTFNIGASFKL